VEKTTPLTPRTIWIDYGEIIEKQSFINKKENWQRGSRLSVCPL